MDPEIFENPDKWDPSRYLPERAEDKKLNKYAWNGWGKGRHPCRKSIQYLALVSVLLFMLTSTHPYSWHASK